MLSKRRIGSTFLALLVLTGALAAAPAAQAAQGAPTAATADAPPRLTTLFGSVWHALLARLSPPGILFAADGEDPPPDPDPDPDPEEEEDEEDPFDGSGGSGGGGSGSGLLDPNGGST